MNIQGSHNWNILFPSWVPDRRSLQRLVQSGMLVGFFFFSPLRPPFFSHPSICSGVWILFIQPTLCCAPSLRNWIGVQPITLLVSLYLPLCSPLSPSLSFPLSLSLRRFAVLPQSWLVFCNRLNPSLSSKGRYFLLFWLSALFLSETVASCVKL